MKKCSSPCRPMRCPHPSPSHRSMQCTRFAQCRRGIGDACGTVPRVGACRAAPTCRLSFRATQCRDLLSCPASVPCLSARGLDAQVALCSVRFAIRIAARGLWGLQEVVPSKAHRRCTVCRQRCRHAARQQRAVIRAAERAPAGRHAARRVRQFAAVTGPARRFKQLASGAVLCMTVVCRAADNALSRLHKACSGGGDWTL